MTCPVHKRKGQVQILKRLSSSVASVSQSSPGSLEWTQTDRETDSSSSAAAAASSAYGGSMQAVRIFLLANGDGNSRLLCGDIDDNDNIHNGRRQAKLLSSFWASGHILMMSRTTLELDLQLLCCCCCCRRCCCLCRSCCSCCCCLAGGGDCCCCCCCYKGNANLCALLFGWCRSA